MKKLDKAFQIIPLYEADGYKVGHRKMLAPNTVREYWTWIPRSLKYMHPDIKKIMSAGQQLVVRYLHSHFKEYFFDQPIDVALRFSEDMCKYLMAPYDGKHYEELHRLGYLPIQIQSLPEGIFTKPNIPHMAGINTKDGYDWLGLFLETMISKLAWQLPTSATIAAKFKENALKYVKLTDPENLWLADYMCHDFHSRGGNPFTSIAVGLGHSMSNKGSDTLNVIPASRYYYDVPEDAVCINSVNASEHSVTCTGIFYYADKLKKGLLNNEIIKYYSFDVKCEGSIENPDYLAIAEWLNLRDWLIKFPDGILSVVSDTFNLWKLITFILPRLKSEILSRNGKLVIRPDSGNPPDIICGDVPKFIKLEDAENYYRNNVNGNTIFQIGENSFYQVIRHSGTNFKVEPVEFKPEYVGVIRLLWNIFGGDITSTGYKRLNSHIGAIYGDSITLERQIEIYDRLANLEFAATNEVVGVGSYTYVLLTRDAAGYAAKGAWFETFDAETKERQSFNIYKEPVTDDGTKKSLKGFQFVYLEDGEYKLKSEVSEAVAFSDDNLLKTIYKDGEFFNQVTFDEVRMKVDKYLNS